MTFNSLKPRIFNIHPNFKNERTVKNSPWVRVEGLRETRMLVMYNKLVEEDGKLSKDGFLDLLLEKGLSLERLYNITEENNPVLVGPIKRKTD